jgi:cell division protein FtsL
MAGGKKSFFFGVFIFFGFLAIVFVAFSTYKELDKKKQVQIEIEKLQQEAARVNRENDSIQEKIAYLQSREYQEREAKDKLNLQSPGENVVVVKPSIVKESKVIDEPKEVVLSETPKQIVPISNFKKWYNYFFN